MIRYGYLPTGSLLSYDIDRLCEFLSGVGYQGIELMPEVALGDAAHTKKLLSAVERNKLTISEVVLQRDLVMLDAGERAEAVSFLTESIKKVADLGVNTVNVFSGPRPWIPSPVIVGKDVSQSTAWGWVFEAFDKVLPVAEKCGVRLAVENVWGMLAHDIFSNLFLQSRYDSKFLGVNLDPSHDILCGNKDMKFLVETWGKDRIFHVHLKDAVGVPVGGKFLFPLLGEGEVNWKEFFASLNAIGYDGFASVEFESWAFIDNICGGDFAKCAEISYDAIQKLTALK